MLHAVFPPECLNCGARVESDFAICGSCWADTPFILGASCDLCGVALPGQAADDEALICEECHQIARPWSAGRAVMGYGGVGRRLVLGLKHGDRAEIARASGPWLARVGADLVRGAPLLVPIPLHWRRLAQRRYNQSALLAQAFGREAGVEVAPQALLRVRATPSQDGRDREARFRNLTDAIRPHPRHGDCLKGRDIVLVDDVMTSGATFAAATEACRMAGAKEIGVIALARVSRDA
ncbi:Competence protein F-like protein, phosphoribosyltransferase domain protein [Roseibacterium elongatum DSM 19469]|uniref:Competence protein F-like protein, phosphoribosyltransferase domain protein n=2 Tax=Roseicyclus elongatus TaxID=159346 RepID=W8RQL1_9RHOB|nr:ComF family protein [Roseibacterium elongatum]AHM03363.1 Competence protein F-like protein, phosphoribosyltransferase domain protein [Roseibacterium elongatum DSM 19469]